MVTQTQALPSSTYPIATNTGAITPIWYQFMNSIWQRTGGGSNTGNVQSVSVNSTNGISSSVTNPTTDPVINLALNIPAIIAQLNIFTPTTPGIVPASGGGTTNFLRSDSTWQNPTATITQPSTGQFWSNFGANINRLNDRVFIGGATVNSGDIPTTTKDWLETLVPATTTNSQFATLSTIGQIAVLGGSRTSDFPSAGSDGCLAVAGYAFNDNIAFPQYCQAGYFEAHATVVAGTSPATLAIEADIFNATGITVAMTPYNFFPTNQTINCWLGSGGPNDASVAIGILNNGAKYNKGIIFQATSIVGTDGVTGTGTAIALGKGHQIEWYNAAGTLTSYISGTVATATNSTQLLFTDNGMELCGPNSSAVLVKIPAVASAANFIQLTAAGAGSGPNLCFFGSDTNVPGFYLTQGSGSHLFLTNAGTTQFTVAHTASATRSITVTGSNGAQPTLSTNANAGLVIDIGSGILTCAGTNSNTTASAPNLSVDSSGNIKKSTASVITNLTGPITSVGNATSIASQTGTGTKFVVDTSPTLITPVLGVASATSLAFSSTSELIGTTTNNNAATGSVGEYVSSSVAQGAPVALANGVTANVTTISLTAGDWDVWANVGFVGGSTTIYQALLGGINTTSVTFPSGTDAGNKYFFTANLAPDTFVPLLAAGHTRISISGTTTVYLVAFATFSTSTLGAFGTISARRRR